MDVKSSLIYFFLLEVRSQLPDQGRSGVSASSNHLTTRELSDLLDSRVGGGRKR